MDWTPELKQRVAAMIEAGRNSAEIAAVIGATRQAVQAGNKRHNLGSIVRRPAPIPADLADTWDDYSQREHAARYGVVQTTVGRWAKALGLPAKPSRETSKARLTNNLAPRKRAGKPGKGWVNNIGPAAPIDRVMRDDSPAGEAVRYLQRFGAVYRCAETGRADVKGDRWRRGSQVYDAAGIIAKAEQVRKIEARRAA